MLTSISQRLIGLLFITHGALMTYLSIRPVSAAVNIIHIDKLFHFIAYLTLSSLAFLLARRLKPFLWWCLAIIIYGAAIELIQSFVPGRYMSLADFFANVCGVGAAYLLARIYLARQARLAAPA